MTSIANIVMNVEPEINTDECECCCDTFNKSNRKKIECPNPQCNYNVCKGCARQYILSSTELPHCMDCQVQWNQRFIVKNLNHSFIDNEYKKHHKALLLERQMSMLPETIPAVTEARLREEYNQKQSEIQYRIKDLQQQIKALKQESWAISNTFFQKNNKGEDPGRKFILPCPDEECRGYLSTAYKCELCKCYACQKCLVLTGKERHDQTHVCDEELVKTTQLIRETSRPCPCCGERIMKASGCDQMWCTNCKTAFSWNTGKIDKGIVHNPHFFQYQKANGANGIPRNPGDVICGGLPNNWWRIRNNLRRILKYPSTSQSSCDCCDEYTSLSNEIIQANHIVIEEQFTELFHSLRNIGGNVLVGHRNAVRDLLDNQDLRVDYLMKKIDKTEMAKELMRRDKRRNKSIEMMHIYELFVTVGNDLINHLCHFIEEPKEARETCQEFTKKMAEFDTFIDYINIEFKHIAVTYNNRVPQVSKPTYVFTQLYKFNKSDLEISV